jgi:hypothetical protein
VVISVDAMIGLEYVSMIAQLATAIRGGEIELYALSSLQESVQGPYLVSIST